jgi:hypothetical protein
LTWRAFIIGLIGVVALSVLTPINDFRAGNTYLTGNHFPVGVFFFLLILTLLVNVVIKLVRSRLVLRQAELMLVWCMMICAASVPASGLMRYWLPLGAAAPYLAQRPDLLWEETVLKEAPEGILLSKDMRSVAARNFYRGTRGGEVVRVPWDRWARYLTTWGLFIGLYYVANFCLFGLLRRQWVERERLTFPLARIPVEFTAGAGSPSLVPPLLRNRGFLLGAGVAVVLGLIRISPVFFGADEGLHWRLPVQTFTQGTPLQVMGLSNGAIFPIAIGFAFLVPADISLSIWAFYLFTGVELLLADYVGRPVPGGTWSAFMVWQQTGAFIVFTLMMIWAARRHLIAVMRRAFGKGRGVDDADEPIGYRFCFWGLAACAAGMAGWYVYFGMSLWVALAMLALMGSIVMVHARLVAQGGLFFTLHRWGPPGFLHAVSGGRAFSAPATVVAQVQNAVMIADSREIFGPHAMNALRISNVFERHRRLFLPVMLAALAVAAIASGYASLRWVYYDIGGQNIKQDYSVNFLPTNLYNRTHSMVTNPARTAEPHYSALGLGAGLMFGLTLMRRTFYWWPIHSLGFLVASSWSIMEVWFSFLLGWLVKVVIVKFGSGPLLREARTFFVGVICAETAVVGVSTIVGLVTGVRIGYIFLSS